MKIHGTFMKTCDTCFAASPPDVLKGSAFPVSIQDFFEAMPQIRI
jgi:hypothetical protein